MDANGQPPPMSHGRSVWHGQRPPYDPVRPWAGRVREGVGHADVKLESSIQDTLDSTKPTLTVEGVNWQKSSLVILGQIIADSSAVPRETSSPVLCRTVPPAIRANAFPNTTLRGPANYDAVARPCFKLCISLLVQLNIVTLLLVH